jgi:hypothetical protein
MSERKSTTTRCIHLAEEWPLETTDLTYLEGVLISDSCNNVVEPRKSNEQFLLACCEPRQVQPTKHTLYLTPLALSRHISVSRHRAGWSEVTNASGRYFLHLKLSDFNFCHVQCLFVCWLTCAAPIYCRPFPLTKRTLTMARNFGLVNLHDIYLVVLSPIQIN